MNTNLLKPKSVQIESIYLDPNNPRFWSQKTAKETPESKITNAEVQIRTLTEIEKYGIEELKNSILRNRFLPLDRIVVRPIKGLDDSFVVVEGNRRIAAIKKLREEIEDESISEDNITDKYLTELSEETNSIEVLIYSGEDTHKIAWLLQGIRHISGIREWAPAQRARLVADQIEKKNLKFREAGQKFGLSAQAVGRLYRSYKALEQMRHDDEYQALAKNEHFTLFEEAIRNKDVKTWLQWNEKNYMFDNIDNLRQFYSWILADEDHDEERRRIHDPSGDCQGSCPYLSSFFV